MTKRALASTARSSSDRLSSISNCGASAASRSAFAARAASVWATTLDVKDSPVTEGDFFATIYTALDVDHRTEHFHGLRPVPVAPFGSKVVTDLLG